MFEDIYVGFREICSEEIPGHSLAISYQVSEENNQLNAVWDSSRVGHKISPNQLKRVAKNCFQWNMDYWAIFHHILGNWLSPIIRNQLQWSWYKHIWNFQSFNFAVFDREVVAPTSIININTYYVTKWQNSTWINSEKWSLSSWNNRNILFWNEVLTLTVPRSIDN